ncbi:HdeD family acid-resistance protein [Cellulomonas shaoxiangyii]|uniref:HdeD family acid-resistance protein n=1 Tax=Cellulomonas shaoxiangyii TaxID=2566013 RepID=A0A4P7SNU0_9CELL|nr:DUF308 domain-containing protein [Cellulomonas shaoxiangyii]QCB94936.1 HdeD family acid-resistance protein [Cellulomonas shaoxiangyii]TGY84444.1 HdeD family acid-resistance protein [Cellulomonas shaoxiangyii]
MVDDVAREVRRTLRKLWWLPVLRGVVLIVLGLLLMAQPEATLGAIVWLFGIFAVVDGVVAVVQGLANRGVPGWGWWVAQGLAGIVVGAIVILWQEPTVRVLFFLLAAWLLVLGVIWIIAAAALSRTRDPGWFWMLASGLVSTLFALLLVARPQETIGVFAVLLGLFAFVAGALAVVSGFAVRAALRDLEQATRAL